MVEKFKIILNRLKKQGEIFLFAILKMDELTDKWSVLLSAPWITEENRKDIFVDVRKLIKEIMTDEEAAGIARIVIAMKDEHLVQELLEKKAGDYIGGTESVKVNGNLVHEAYILESNKIT